MQSSTGGLKERERRGLGLERAVGGKTQGQAGREAQREEGERGEMRQKDGEMGREQQRETQRNNHQKQPAQSHGHEVRR